MIELDDCGNKLRLKFMKHGEVHLSDVKVIMVINAPRGTMALFEPVEAGTLGWTKQAKAIKAFVRRHKDD